MNLSKHQELKPDQVLIHMLMTKLYYTLFIEKEMHGIDSPLKELVFHKLIVIKKKKFQMMTHYLHLELLNISKAFLIS